MIKQIEYTDIEQLKGIKIFYENDFYQYAKIVIKIMDAHDEFQRNQNQNNTTGISRPTIYGLARRFATTADSYFPEKYVLNILKKHGFTGKEVLNIKNLEKF